MRRVRTISRSRAAGSASRLTSAGRDAPAISTVIGVDGQPARRDSDGQPEKQRPPAAVSASAPERRANIACAVASDATVEKGPTSSSTVTPSNASIAAAT